MYREKEDAKEIGSKLRQLRKAMGLTQEKFAEKLEIDNKHLSKIENGKYYPSYKTMKKISDVLKTDITNVELSSKIVKEIDTPYFKSLKILSSAKTDKEKQYYFEVLSLAQKGLSLIKD